MGRKPNTTNALFKASAAKNKISYLTYFERLISLAMSLFQWEGLPESCNERFLELTLTEKGYALFFQDEIMGYLTLPCMIGGRLDVYNIPIDRTAYASNGYNNRLNKNNSIIIYNNMLHTNDYAMLQNYASRLWQLDQIIDINANAQKTPILISCDEKQRLTLKNLYQKYDGNEPFIFGDKSLTDKILTAINTGAPFVADKLYQLRTNIWNEALTYIGIPNISIQKKERLITDEVQRMNAGAVSGRYSRLQARQQAADEINSMFNLNVSVHVRESTSEDDINPPAPAGQQKQQTEEGETA